MSNILICKHCSKSFDIKQFGNHILKIHNIPYKEYVKNNFEDFVKFGWNKCPLCNSPIKGKACPGECLTTYYSNLRKGVLHGPMSEETKKKLSEDRKQKYMNGWAPRVGKYHSEESKQKMSVAHEGYTGIKGDLNPACRKEVREQISKTRIEKGLSKGENNPMFGKTHTPESIRKIFSHRPMNKLEQKVANELKKNGVDYTFQFFINDGEVCKSYDFKIKDKPVIIEVDGDFWHGNPDVKNHFDKVGDVKENDLLKEEMAKTRGYKVIRLWESDINKDVSVVMNSLR
jgi:very-short-patch-repair endonuclease